MEFTTTDTRPHVTCPQPTMTKPTPVNTDSLTQTEPQAAQQKIALDGQTVEEGFGHGV